MTAHTLSRPQFDNVMIPTYQPDEAIPIKGLGSRVWDQTGKEYIDFAGGIAVNALGHCHPNIVKTLTEQANRIWHLSNVFTNEPAIKLATQLTEATFAEKVFFANSGAEANEAALKLARRYALDCYGPHKNQIIAFKRGFHGRTFFTVSVGGQETYSMGFGPKPGAIDHANYNDLESVASLISDDTCAVILEPLQGEGGVLIPDHSFLKGVAALCKQHDALLIFDEVQTGMGRTGKLYGYMHTDVIPNILTTAKALGAGIPIGAMLTSSEIGAHLKPGTHGSTFGGNPLSCAVASTAFSEINKPELLKGVLTKESLFRQGLTTISEKYAVFDELRGKGLLLGAHLSPKWQGKSRELMKLALKSGVMCLVAGPDVIRFTPSLIIPEEDINEGLNRLEQAIKAFI